MNHEKELDAAVNLVNGIKNFKKSCPFMVCGVDMGELQVSDARVFGAELTEEEFDSPPYDVMLSFIYKGIKVLSVHTINEVKMPGKEAEDD